MHIRGLDHIVLRVADVERSLAWYVEEIGLTPDRLDEWRRGEVPFPSVRVDGSTIIDLVAGERTGTNMEHLCLVVDRADVDGLVADGRLPIVEGPGDRSGARGIGWSVYVDDPDGNTVELRSYDD